MQTGTTEAAASVVRDALQGTRRRPFTSALLQRRLRGLQRARRHRRAAAAEAARRGRGAAAEAAADSEGAAAIKGAASDADDSPPT